NWHPRLTALVYSPLLLDSYSPLTFKYAQAKPSSSAQLFFHAGPAEPYRHDSQLLSESDCWYPVQVPYMPERPLRGNPVWRLRQVAPSRAAPNQLLIPDGATASPSCTRPVA